MHGRRCDLHKVFEQAPIPRGRPSDGRISVRRNFRAGIDIISDMSRLIIVFVGLITAVAFALAADDSGHIKASGKPGRAGLFINGKYIGPAARFTVVEKYECPTGEVEVSLRDPRYEEYTTKITIQRGKTAKVKYSLKKLPEPQGPFGRFRLGGGEAPSFISVTSGDVGAVYLNGKFFGYVDELNNPGSGILLPPGSYDLHVSSPLFGEITQKINIEANKLTIVPLPKK